MKSKGYRLAINSVAVNEWIARAALGRGDRGAEPSLFMRQAQRLAKHLDGACPAIPERGDLLPIIYADGMERERMLERQVSRLRDGWSALVSEDAEKLMHYGRRAAQRLEQDGTIYTNLNAFRGRVTKGATWEEVFEEILPTFESSDGKHPRHTERLHATPRVNTLRAAKMLANAKGRKDFVPNDTPDVLMLAVVGLGAFVATDDKPLIADVRESRTYQAPWTRTVPEFLAVDVDDLPRGLPWGDEAKREAERFYATLEGDRSGPGLGQ